MVRRGRRFKRISRLYTSAANRRVFDADLLRVERAKCRASRRSFYREDELPPIDAARPFDGGPQRRCITSHGARLLKTHYEFLDFA
jgi:hypothetical protein